MVEENKQKLENVNIAGKNKNKNIIIFIMSNNSWIAPLFGSIAGLIILGFSYNMYDNNKKAAIETESKNIQQMNWQNRDEAFGGRKTKRRKYRKNASKKKR